MLGVGLLLTVGTGLFVASEFALVNLDRADLEARQEARRDAALAHDQRAEDHVDAPLQRAAGHHADHAAHRLHDGAGDLEPARARVRRRGACPPASSRPLAAVIGVSIATMFSMILGELVPKNFALAVPRQTAKLVMPFQVGVHDGVPARDRRAQRQRERRAARGRHRAEGGAVGRPHGRGALEPGPPLGERRRARGGHRVPPRPQPHLRPPVGAPT